MGGDSSGTVPVGGSGSTSSETTEVTSTAGEAEAGSTTASGESTVEPDPTGDDTSAGSSTGSTGRDAVCGDGVVEGDEGCDPGSDPEGSCTQSCQLVGTKLWETSLWPVCDTGVSKEVDVRSDGTVAVISVQRDVCHQPAEHDGINLGTLNFFGELLAESLVVDWGPTQPSTLVQLGSGESLHYGATGLIHGDPFSVLAWNDDTDEVWRWTDEDTSVGPYRVTVSDDVLYATGLEAELGFGFRPVLAAVADGQQLWTHTFFWSDASVFGDDESPLTIDVSGGRVYALYGRSDASLCSVDLDGLEPLCQPIAGFVTTGAVADDSVFTGTRGDDIVISRRDLDGSVLWSTPLPDINAESDGFSQLVVGNQRVYALGTRYEDSVATASIVALDATDGEVLLDVSDPWHIVEDAALAQDGSLVVIGTQLEEGLTPTSSYAARWAF